VIKHNLFFNLNALRNPSVPPTNEIFLLGEKQLGVVSKYQYLGLLLTEFLHYNEMAKAVARLAGGALSFITSRPVSKNTTPLLNTRRFPTHIPINGVIRRIFTKTQKKRIALCCWCKHKALNVNFEKTKIVHFRNPSVPPTNEIFLLGEKHITLHLAQFLKTQLHCLAH
jgi:hypothetical protein